MSFREKEFLKNQTIWAWILNKEGERRMREGELMWRLELAQTLSQIAKEGSAAFYKGEIAQFWVRTIQENGGIITLEDMNNYRSND